MTTARRSGFRLARLAAGALALSVAGCAPAGGGRPPGEGSEKLMISPKVVSVHTPDASSPEAVVASIIRPGMSSEDVTAALNIASRMVGASRQARTLRLVIITVTVTVLLLGLWIATRW